MDMDKASLEQEVRELCARGDMAGAVERTLQGYGQEHLRFMHAVLHHPELAQDAFSLFCENLLKGMPAFRWESSLRTWTYRLARNACYQVRHSPLRREEPMSASALPEVAPAERTATRPWQRTSVKERFRALRQQLPPEDRVLLMLRVDQRLSWRDIARIVWEGEGEPDAAALARKEGALRQQFTRLKLQLRALAQEAGLLPTQEGEEPPPPR